MGGQPSLAPEGLFVTCQLLLRFLRSKLGVGGHLADCFADEVARLQLRIFCCGACRKARSRSVIGALSLPAELPPP